MNKSGTGNIFWKYVTLNILGMIGLSCYILADTIFVARGVGPNGLTALNLAIPIYSFIHGTGLMIGMGGATRYSISRSKTVFTQSFIYTILLSLIYFIIGLCFSGQLATLLLADGETHQMTRSYLQVILCFAPMFMMNNLIICFVRNDGNPKLSMIAMLTGSFSNIVLDYVFVFPFGLGMFGAALATGIAPVISLLVLSTHFFQKKNTFSLKKLCLHGKEILDISLLGASSLITEFSSGIVIIIFNRIILSMKGNIGVAAYGIIANIALVIIAIYSGISQGIQPIVSKSYGMGDNTQAAKYLKNAIMLAIVLSVIVYAGTFTFAEGIVSLFNKENDKILAAIAVNGMRIYFTAFLFVGINILSATYFNSVDQPKKAFLISILRGFVIIIPVAFISSDLFGMTGVWLALTITEFLVFLVVLWIGMHNYKRIKHTGEKKHG